MANIKRKFKLGKFWVHFARNVLFAHHDPKCACTDLESLTPLIYRYVQDVLSSTNSKNSVLPNLVHKGEANRRMSNEMRSLSVCDLVSKWRLNVNVTRPQLLRSCLCDRYVENDSCKHCISFTTETKVPPLLRVKLFSAGYLSVKCKTRQTNNTATRLMHLNFHVLSKWKKKLPFRGNVLNRWNAQPGWRSFGISFLFSLTHGGVFRTAITSSLL